MNFVNDVHAVLSVNRRKFCFVPDIPDVVHTVVRGGVNFHYIQNATVIYPATNVTLVTWVPIHGMLAVDRLCKNFCAGGFACTPGPGKQVSVGMSPGHDFIHEGFRNMGLTYYICKDLGSPFAIQCLVHFRASFSDER